MFCVQFALHTVYRLDVICLLYLGFIHGGWLGMIEPEVGHVGMCVAREGVNTKEQS